jgi:glycosyltransferase involved in cell wall biosynthesis
MKYRQRHLTEPPSPGFVPVRVDEVELGSALVDLPPPDPQGPPFAASLSLVRLHGRPLGLIEVDLPVEGLPAEALAARIQSDLADEIAAHLRSDGLAPVELSVDGISGPDRPPCIEAREALIDDAPEVSVVVITRGRPQRVLRTVRSILRSRYPSERYEVIVVDTPEAGDSTVAGLLNAELDGKVRVRVVEEPTPGISRARNTGMRASNAEILAFADDDADVDRNWLGTLVSAFGLGRDVGATAGITLPGALETPSQRWFEGHGGLERGFETRVFSLADPPADQPLFPFTPGALGSGRSMAFRRQVLSDLGGFDLALGPPTPTRAGEDLEALLRVVLAGHEVVHDPAAIVWHAHLPDYAMLRRRMFGYGAGLAACLTKSVTRNPRLVPDLLRKLPGGVAFALSPKSAKNERRQEDFPRVLARLELLGMAYGPLAYVQSRRQYRRSRNGRTGPPQP